MEKEILENGLNMNRRRFLSRLSLGIGSVALGSLLIPDLFRKNDEEAVLTGLAQFAPKAKRVIYLFQNGAPSQLDLFDYKPLLQKMHGEDLPASIRQGQRLTGMTADQKNNLKAKGKDFLDKNLGGFGNLFGKKSSPVNGSGY